ncbi:MAG: hypothetical protein AB7T86_14625 [Xanthobacteraceae bacterium]|uniref:hypothetical protein n=1 Tax=Pseudolabrys sp. TaxID=1960880 RepID=UPI003D0C652E
MKTHDDDAVRISFRSELRGFSERMLATQQDIAAPCARDHKFRNLNRGAQLVSESQGELARWSRDFEIFANVVLIALR